VEVEPLSNGRGVEEEGGEDSTEDSFLDGGILEECPFSDGGGSVQTKPTKPNLVETY
jgi:hypothetical protein